jgi:hypothetical protein
MRPNPPPPSPDLLEDLTEDPGILEDILLTEDPQDDNLLLLGEDGLSESGESGNALLPLALATEDNPYTELDALR